MEQYTTMFECTGQFLNAIEEVQPPPLHPTLGDTWWTTMERELAALMKESEVSATFTEQTYEVFDCFKIGYKCLSNALVKVDFDRLARIQDLQAKPQSVQRSDEWYREAMSLLTASELYNLFGSPRARGQLVMCKVPRETLSPAPAPKKSCMTAEMTPFDWGTRFEPVAKQILEAKWGATIVDLGRLRHPTIASLAASPDGLITATDTKHQALLGNLVEIKCPSSRVVGGGVPPNYWYQMQLQMEVAEVPVCQYCEFTFKSATARGSMEEAPLNATEGLIYLLQNHDTLETKYVYGPIGDMKWNPQPEAPWHVLERIPWFLEKSWIHPVYRDTAWFQSVIPLLDDFWRDVEKAKRGEFALPESSVKRKSTACAITD